MLGKKHGAFSVRITAEGTGHKEGHGDTSAKPIFCAKPVWPVQGGVTVCRAHCPKSGQEKTREHGRNAYGD